MNIRVTGRPFLLETEGGILQAPRPPNFKEWAKEIGVDQAADTRKNSKRYCRRLPLDRKAQDDNGMQGKLRWCMKVYLQHTCCSTFGLSDSGKAFIRRSNGAGGNVGTSEGGSFAGEISAGNDATDC